MFSDNSSVGEGVRCKGRGMILLLLPCAKRARQDPECAPCSVTRVSRVCWQQHGRRWRQQLASFQKWQHHPHENDTVDCAKAIL